MNKGGWGLRTFRVYLCRVDGSAYTTSWRCLFRNRRSISFPQKRTELIYQSHLVGSHMIHDYFEYNHDQRAVHDEYLYVHPCSSYNTPSTTFLHGTDKVRIQHAL